MLIPLSAVLEECCKNFVEAIREAVGSGSNMLIPLSAVLEECCKTFVLSSSVSSSSEVSMRLGTSSSGLE